MAYAYVAGTYANVATLNNYTISAGQQIIAIAFDRAAINSTLTLADGTNTYTPRGQMNEARDTQTARLLDCLNPTPGTYTVTESGATQASFALYKYTGLDSYSAGSFASHDYNTGTPSTATDAMATTAVSATAYPALLFCFAFGGGATSNYLVGTDFNTVRSQIANPSPIISLEDLRLLSGSHIGSWTVTTGASSVGVIAATYIEAGSAADPLTVVGKTARSVFGPRRGFGRI